MDNKKTILDIALKNLNCIRATIELCTICNWECKHCYLNKHEDIGLEIKNLKMLLKKLRTMGVYELVLTGGEIFCRKDVFEIIEFARKLGFLITILSNASLLNDEMVNKLINLNIYEYDCTIFSLKEEVHDMFTQVEGSLVNTLTNIKKLKKGKIKVKVKHVITKYAMNEVENIKQFCLENDYIYLGTIDIYAKNNGDRTPYDYCVEIDEIENIIKSIDMFQGYSYIDDSDESYICKSTRWSIFIASNGDIYPCGNFKKKLGNVLVDDIEIVWNENKILKEIQNAKFKNTKCKGCSLINRCFRCSGILYNEMHDYKAISEKSCQIAKIRKKLFD